MQSSSRFTIAVHVLLCIDTFKNDQKVTSDFLASSVNANPVVIRRLLQQLKAAGIIHVARGTGGADLARPTDRITLLDIYHAVESVDGRELFRFHENPNPLCPVGKNIHAVLDTKLDEIQAEMEQKMESITIQHILTDMQRLLSNPPV